MKKILFILIASLLYSCSSVSEKKSELNTEFTKLRSITPKNLEFSGKVDIDMNGQSLSLNTDIYSAASDSVLMILKAFMGIPAAKVYANPSTFMAYNALENKAFYGEPTKENMVKAMRFGFSYTDMIALLRNEPNFDLDYKINKEGTNEKEILYYRYFKDEFIEYIKYNIKDNYITQYQQKSSDNNLLLNVFFEEPKKVGKRNMPHKVTALIQETEGSVKFRFDEIKSIDKFEKGFNFSIPTNVTKIKL